MGTPFAVRATHPERCTAPCTPCAALNGWPPQQGTTLRASSKAVVFAFVNSNQFQNPCIAINSLTRRADFEAHSTRTPVCPPTPSAERRVPVDDYADPLRSCPIYRPATPICRSTFLPGKLRQIFCGSHHLPQLRLPPLVPIPSGLPGCLRTSLNRLRRSADRPGRTHRARSPRKSDILLPSTHPHLVPVSGSGAKLDTNKAKHKDHTRRHEHGPITCLYFSREHPSSQRTRFRTLLLPRHGEDERARRREGPTAEPTRPADAAPSCEARPTPRRAAPARGARPSHPQVCGRAGRHVLYTRLWLP